MLITGAARLAGVMGWPVAHSLSPALHGHWFARHGVDGAYVPLPVQPQDVALAFRALPRVGFLGWNVTIPHKEAAFRLVDERDAAAERMGAVNTVLVRPDGSLFGRNTDGLGFLANLRAQARGWRPEAGPAGGLGTGGGGRAGAAAPPGAGGAAGPAVVLGTGGGARAVATALLDAGVPALRLANRTRGRAEELADALRAIAAVPVPVEIAAWEAREGALVGAGLVVNATSLGMKR